MLTIKKNLKTHKNTWEKTVPFAHLHLFDNEQKHIQAILKICIQEKKVIVSISGKSQINQELCLKQVIAFTYGKSIYFMHNWSLYI